MGIHLKLFGYQLIIGKIPPVPRKLGGIERLFKACDEINHAWRMLENQKGNTIRPWIVWEDKEVIITSRKGAIEVLHETR